MSSLLKISVSVIFVFLFPSVLGGDPYRPSAGAGEAGMGYACITRSSLWSSFHNQASLAYYKVTSAGFNYENRFGIKELGTRTAAVSVSEAKTTLAAVYSHFGCTDFKRELAGLACGIKLSENVAAGVQVDYFSNKTYGEYDNYQSVTFEAGIIINPSEVTKVGVHVFNPVPNSVRKNSLPLILRVGGSTCLSKNLITALESEISTGRNLILRTGLEYEVAEKFLMRCGFSTDNNSFGFGLGYLVKFVLIDFSFTTHDRLGITSSASLIFNIH